MFQILIPQSLYGDFFNSIGQLPTSRREYEYAIGWFPGLTWKTEYRFADYGTDNVRFLDVGVPSDLSVDVRKYVQTVRSELVWRFNFGGPIVARY